jgi:hypothetical protein
MNTGFISNNFEDRLNQILPKVTSGDFLNSRGLGNEIGFWVFDYPPERELDMRQFLSSTIEPALTKAVPTIRHATVNLFDQVIGLLEERRLLDKAIDLQARKGDQAVLKELQSVLKEDRLAERIAGQIDSAITDVIFLTGVGAAYPMLRTHTLLSALHAWVKDTPVLMFYPGRYDGYSLRLFNKLADDHYYRAFRLVP